MTATRPTHVLNVRGIPRSRRLRLQADPEFVYVGRGVRSYWKKSDWRNPFKPGMTFERAMKAWLRVLPGKMPPERLIPKETEGEMIHQEVDAVEWYREYLARTPLRKRIKELRGKTLGCWCCNWAPGELLPLDYGERRYRCHAILLAELANGKRASK